MNKAQRIAHLLTAIENCRKANNLEWLQKHQKELDSLEQTLPSGSGFDAGTQLLEDKSTPEKLVFQTSFHHINEHGGYDGWTEHLVTVTPSLVFDLNVKVGGRNRNEIKDYIGEAMYHSLVEEGHNASS